MRLKGTTTSLLLAACLSAPALSVQPRPSAVRTPDEMLFLDAVALSYNGQHDAARKEFEEYQRRHPDDLLVPIRLVEDQLFDVNLKPDAATYDRLLGIVDAAIGTYVSKQCSGTDLRGIGNGALDCDYAGAALYSFRVALRIKRDGKFANWSENGADDKQFRTLAERSFAETGSCQAEFLLGVHEYEASGATVWHLPAAWLLRKKGIPVDQEHAIRMIQAALGDKSPFADDVWFYVLWVEIKNKPGADEFAKKFSEAAIVTRLYPKYPHNRLLEDGFHSFSDTFESY